ncbi:MAG: UPF0755 protein [Chloroflexi bacterium]|nr:MAG: UPF0755 protein [Chloroflexota bacterium]
MIRSGAWLLSTALVLAVGAVAVLLSLGSPDAVLNDVPAFRPERPAQAGDIVLVEIPTGATAEQIADELFRRGVITSTRQFQTLVGLLGYEDRLVIGTYDFEPGLLTIDVIERIRSGVTSELVVTIPEGLQAAEIFDRIAQATPLTVAQLQTAAADPSIAVGTLAGNRPQGVSLEGYLFPSTYVISRLADGEDVIRQMLQRFDAQFPPALQTELTVSGRDLHTLLIVASIVEREAVLPTERQVIASVFWNRIRVDQRLEADPTVQYALAQDPTSVAVFGAWKSLLTSQDLQIVSPWNTYVTDGLPPTPIASPGLESILATLRPAETTFFFFVARGDGGHLFADTFAEHSDNVDRVRGQ